MAIEVTVKKWGNSLGLVLPKEFVEERHLRDNEHVLVEVVKEADLSKHFGRLKRTMTGQDFKNMIRKGWSE